MGRSIGCLLVITFGGPGGKGCWVMEEAGQRALLVRRGGREEVRGFVEVKDGWKGGVVQSSCLSVWYIYLPKHFEPFLLPVVVIFLFLLAGLFLWLIVGFSRLLGEIEFWN